MFGSEENKYRILVLAVLFVSFTFILLYYHTTVNNNFERESEQLLYNVGINYESEIKSEFVKFSSITGLLASTIEKNIEEKEFDKKIKEVFSELIYNNTRLQSIELVMHDPEFQNDTSNFFLGINDSIQKQSIKLSKKKNGIVDESGISGVYSDNMLISVEKAKISDKTIILSPENIQDEGSTITVVPIFSSIYKGNHFLGYIMVYISVNWISQNNYGKSKILDYAEIFVSSSDGKILAINKNQNLIAESIDKTCLSCKELLGNKGQEYNSGTADNYFTVCIPWQPIPEIAYWNICIRVPKNEIKADLGHNEIYSLIIAIIILLLASISIVYILRKYTNLWFQNETLAKHVLIGDVVEIEDPDKHGKGKSDGFKKILLDIAGSLNKLASINKSAITGNFEEEIENEFRKHQLYKTTKELHFKYKSSVDKLKSENDSLKQFKHLTDGLGKINEVLKQHHNDLYQLSINVIHTMVDLLEIEMGAIFLLKSEGGKQFLESIVSYAYSENRFQKRSFNYGESLVGACAAEKRTIYLKKVPEDYLKVMSGLGLASPKTILIVPLLFEGTVLGVIEMGSLNDFNDEKIAFTERAAETIANTMSMAEINIQAVELLEKTKQQTIELEKRDKLMHQALDELKDLQNKTATSEASIRAKLEAMNNTLMMVEYTSRGILLDANYKYLNAMNFARDEIIGIDVLDLLKESERAELIKIINSVKNGNFYEGVMLRHTRQGDEKWLLATYTPVYNDKNEVERILFFAIDITRMRKNEAQLKSRIQELTSEVQELRVLLKKEND